MRLPQHVGLIAQSGDGGQPSPSASVRANRGLHHRLRSIRLTIENNLELFHSAPLRGYQQYITYMLYTQVPSRLISVLPSALLPIRDRFAALFQRARDDQNAGCQTDYVHAAIIADQMMSNASELRGLHGDLHHENIMFSSRGWLVIDPVGLVGEVGFGAANMFYDPADRDDLCLDPRRIAQMADAFSRALDVDPRRLLDQAYAYGCLSAAWNADGEEEQRDLAIAAAIKQVRQTSY